MSENSTMTEGQAAPARERPTRKRGVGFPVVALPQAVSILRKAGQYGSEHKLDAFAGYMGHSTANSGTFKRRIAAFKDWKFIAGGTGDRVVFTDLGRRVAYPTDPAKEKQDLQEAFRNCDIFWKVYDESAKGVLYSLKTLANFAVRQLGVAPISKDRFAESLAESAVAAGFAEMNGGRVTFVEPGGGTAHGDLKGDMPQDLGGPGHVVDWSAVAVGRQAKAVTVDDDEDELEDASFPTRRPIGPSGSRGPWAGGITPTPTGPSDWSDRPAGGIVASPRPSQGGWVPEVAGRDMTIMGPAEKPAALYQQSWDTTGGSLSFEIRSNRSLPADAFVQVGRVMSEIEKLKDLLTEGSGGSGGAEKLPTERDE